VKDMHFKLKNKLEELYEIQLKLVNDSLNNIKWSCLYSGLGIINPLTKKEIQEILSNNENNEELNFYLKNYVPLSCIYESGIPNFSTPSKEILNPGKFMWDDKHHKRILTVEAQAYAILSLCYSLELVNQDDNFEIYMLNKTSKMIYDFVSTYLRNDDGLYVDGFDKSKITDKNKKIKLDDKKLKPESQILMLEALLYLHKISNCQDSSEPNKKQKSWSRYEIYSLEAENLFNYINASFDLLIDLPTKELSNIISSICRCYTITCLGSIKPDLYMLVIKLSAELNTRVRISGEIEKDCLDKKTASLLTHFKATSALLEGFAITGLTVFKENALNIYKSTLDLYDTNLSLFHECNVNDINFNIADISEMIKALLLCHKFSDDANSTILIKQIYCNILGKMGIIQSSIEGQVNDELDEQESYLQKMNKIDKPPVFLKNFKMNLSKSDLELKISKYFNSRYSLYASYILLYYLNCE
jgi:hypothetical protein